MNTFMDKLSAGIEKYLMPITMKMSANRYIITIRDSLIATMPLTILGSLCLMVATLPIPAWSQFMAANPDLNTIIRIPFNMSVSIISLYVAFGVGFNLSKQYDLGSESLVAGVSSLFIFLIMVGGVGSGYLGAQGMFTAIIAGVLNVEIMNFCIKKNVVIRLPEQVPPNIAGSFRSLVPIVISTFTTIVLVHLIGFDVNGILATVITPIITAAGDTLLCAILYVVLATLMWFGGIHPQILATLLTPGWTIMAAANAEAYAAGAVAQYIFVKPFFFMFIFIGGQCGTLMLNLVMLRSKSKTHRSLAQMALPAGIFNINEPMLFGLPIVLNATLIVPALIGQLVCLFTTYFAFSTGLVPPMVAPDAAVWNIPALLGAYLCTNSWRAIVLVLVNMVIQGLIYMPFYRVVEKEMVAQENGEALA